MGNTCTGFDKHQAKTSKSCVQHETKTTMSPSHDDDPLSNGLVETAPARHQPSPLYQKQPHSAPVLFSLKKTDSLYVEKDNDAAALSLLKTDSYLIPKNKKQEKLIDSAGTNWQYSNTNSHQHKTPLNHSQQPFTESLIYSEQSEVVNFKNNQLPTEPLTNGPNQLLPSLRLISSQKQSPPIQKPLFPTTHSQIFGQKSDPTAEEGYPQSSHLFSGISTNPEERQSPSSHMLAGTHCPKKSTQTSQRIPQLIQQSQIQIQIPDNNLNRTNRQRNLN